MAEAEATVEWLAGRTHPEVVAHRVWLLRLQTLLARAHDDAAAYGHLRDRYRDMARSLELDGHIAWAEALPCWWSSRTPLHPCGVGDFAGTVQPRVDPLGVRS